MLDEKYLERQIISDLEAEDEELNNRAFRYLYKHVYPLVYSFIRQRRGTKREADDIFQDAMVVLYEIIKNRKFRGESNINTFLYSIVRNMWFSKLKKAKRMVHVEDMSNTAEMEVTEKKIPEDRLQLILAMLEQLGESCKSILKQYYFDHCSMRDIKNSMGFSSEESAKTQKYKCMQKLIAFIDDNPALKEALKDCI